MSLRKKTLVIVGIVVLALIAGQYYLTRVLMLSSFRMLEQHNAVIDLARVQDAIHNEISALERACKDYAVWDDSYQFMADSDQTFIKVDLADQALMNLNVDLVLFLQPSGKVHYVKTISDSSQSTPPLTAESIESLGSRFSPTALGEDGQRSGILMLALKPMLVAACPIIKSNGEGPARGTLIMAGCLDQEVIQHVSQITHISVGVFPVADQNIPAEVRRAADQLMAGAANVFMPQKNDKIAGYALLKDIDAQSQLVLGIQIPRDVYAQGITSARYLVFSMLVVSILFGVIILFLLEKLVLSRLAQLNSQVNSIASLTDFSARIPVVGKDELSGLAVNINNMLAALEQSDAQLQQYSQNLEKLAEERTRELKISESKLRSIFDSSPDAITVTDTDGQIIDVNQAALDVFGISSKDEAVGSTIFEYISPPEQSRALKDLEKTPKDKLLKNVEYILMKRDGTTFPAELSASFIQDHNFNFVCFVIISRDISDRKKTQEALAQSEHRFRVLFERNLAGVYRSTLDGRIIDCNDSFARIFGYPSREEILDVSMNSLYRNLADRDAYLNHLQDQGSTSNYEFQFQHKDGSPIWVMGNSTLILGEIEEPLMIQGTVMDVTELKLNQEREQDLQLELMQQSKLAGIGMLAGGIAHNVNVPLQGIIMHVEMQKLIHPELTDLDEILKQALRISSIINNMLHKSRQEQSQQEQDIDLNKLLSEELAFLNADMTFKHEINKSYDLDPDLPVIRGLYSDFSQALLNLVRNAIDAMHQSGKKWLTIKTRCSDEGGIMIEVKDTGCGIKPEFRDRIFEPFFTTKPLAGQQVADEPVGTGLGLSSAHQLMRKYNARFEIQSEVDMGTTIRIFIPHQQVSLTQQPVIPEVDLEAMEPALQETC